MKVMGIDPGSQVTGWGLVHGSGNRFQSAGAGEIRAPHNEELIDRLARMHREVVRLLATECPDAVALETPFFARSVHATLVLGQVRGVLLLAIRDSGIQLFEYAPREVKSSITGRGGATKEQVQFMVVRLLGLKADTTLDASDALAVALCHHHRARRPVLST
ncbi:MAG TPA: crossover junction endodeoxyribonuclease RuvC [Candidatus Eisenbacteria bacterium]